VLLALLSVKYGFSTIRPPASPEVVFKITGQTDDLSITVKIENPPPVNSGKTAVAPGAAQDVPGNPISPFLIGLGIVISLGITYLIYRKRKRVAPPAAPPGSYLDKRVGLPSLSQKDEDRLFSNFQELSMVESNLFCNKAEEVEVKTFYISSCFNGEGKTLSAINMAFALTINANSKVLLVDGNPRSPVLHRRFNVEKDPGLINLYQDPSLAGAVIRETRYKNLFLVPFGSSHAGRPNLVKGNWLKQINNRFLERFDYLIFDGNSLLGSSDSVMVASNFDGVVIVVEAESTKWGVVQSVIEKMAAANVHVVGTVLNKRKYYIPRFLYGRI
jgi:capsular exopolysaccharide synthesis family protein